MKTLMFSVVATSALLVCATGCHRSANAMVSQTTLTSMSSGPAPFATPPVLPGTPDIPSLVGAVRQGVVNITATQEIRLHREDGVDPFEFFFGEGPVPHVLPGGPPHGGIAPHGLPGGAPQEDEVLKQRGLGSGFIIDAAGHVATNAHVVKDATEVKVTLPDGRELDATVKGHDDRLDLAVLEVKGVKDLPHEALGSSDALRVGEYVVAIGNPYGLGDTVTMGIVSAKSREIGAGPYDDFIQTDASINPGNSGGPLFNLKGEVVGINTAITAQGRGIGFAIPIDAFKFVLPQLMAKGFVSRGKLGIAVQAIDERLAKAMGLDHTTGALVGDVERGGPADKAGLKSGDVIEGIDNTPIERAHDFPRLIARHEPGSHVSLNVTTGKNRRNVDVVLGELTDEPNPAKPAATPHHNSAPATPSYGLQLVDSPHGVMIHDVDSRGAAAEVLEPGEVLVEVNGVPVKNARDAAEKLAASPKDRPALLKVRHMDVTRFVGLERR